MRLSSLLRGYGAVVMGLLITAAFGLFILIFGSLWRLVISALACLTGKNPLPNSFEKMAKYWAWVMHRVCIRAILKVRVEVEGTVKPLRQGEVVVCIVNHPSTLAVPAFFWFVTQRIAPCFLVVAKREHLTNPLAAPFVGVPLWAMQSGIFINRRSADAAFGSIRAALGKLAKKGGLIIIFPDMRRPTPERIEADRVYFSTEIPGLEHWLDYTLVPRSGGLQTILTHLREMGYQPRIVNITIGFSASDWSVRDATHLAGAVLHLEVEEQRRLPLEKKALQMYLTEEWKLKNARIGRWRSAY